MANPTSFTFNPTEQTFTFSNHHIAITADTTIVPAPPAPPESVTVDSVTLAFDNPSPHDGDAVPPPHWPQTECSGCLWLNPRIPQHQLSNQQAEERTEVLLCLAPPS
jgi:hypothetical protein